MVSLMHRLLPFLRRRRSKAYDSNRANQEAYSSTCNDSDEEDDDELSGAWLTVESREGGLYRQGHRVSGSSSSNKLLPGSLSLRLLSTGKSEQKLQLNEFVVDEDISNGRERHKIPALSFKRRDKAPRDYHYVTDHVLGDRMLYIDSSLANMSSCGCSGDCSSGTCNCADNQPSGRYYNSKGRLSSSYNIQCPEVIYECNAGCKCNPKQCANKTIQRGSRIRVALIRTKSRGWGVRTLEPLSRGTFVGVYSGELISAIDSCKRKDDTYLFNLSNTHVQQVREEEHQQQEQQQPAAANEANEQPAAPGKEAQFVCDAKFYGNFTRFINHSCSPNVIGIRAFTSHQDNSFPHIAFFTNQPIEANKELTLNYGDNYWLVKCKRDKVYCLCKQANCKFTLKKLSAHKRHV